MSIQVIEGEGATYQVGSRSARGITIEVTDAAGAKVSGATVSFQLPEQGPTGQFPTGSRTEVVPAGADGRAAAWGMKWGSAPGEVQIRVTAARGSARASRMVAVTLTQAAATGQAQSGGSYKWVWIALLAAGAAGGASVGLAGSKTPAPSAGPIQTPPPVIGSPSISITRP